MDDYESLSHTTWDCKYHVVFIPKCRRKTLYQELRRHLGEVFRKPAHQKESKVEEGQTQFRGAAFLGPRILRQHRRARRGAIRAYIRNQEKEVQRLEQLNLWR